MPRKSRVSMRRLARASANAGPLADAGTVAMHYVAPVLARFISGTDAAFLKELTTRAQPVAGQLQPPFLKPSATECAVAQDAFKKVKLYELAFGWMGVFAMSVVCGMWYRQSASEHTWLGFLFPFLGPGFVAYIFVAQIGACIGRAGDPYRSAVLVAARVLAAERQTTDYWKDLSWRDLELRVAELFTARGYKAHATPGSGDEGVDVLAETDNRRIVIQCKQYSRPAQREIVSELLGVKIAKHADEAILICTGGFTKAAEDYASANGIVLWDLEDLARESRQIADSTF